MNPQCRMSTSANRNKDVTGSMRVGVRGGVICRWTHDRVRPIPFSSLARTKWWFKSWCPHHETRPPEKKKPITTDQITTPEPRRAHTTKTTDDDWNPDARTEESTHILFFHQPNGATLVKRTGTMVHHIDKDQHQLLSFFMAATVTIVAATITPSAMRHGARTVSVSVDSIDPPTRAGCDF